MVQPNLHRHALHRIWYTTWNSIESMNRIIVLVIWTNCVVVVWGFQVPNQEYHHHYSNNTKKKSREINKIKCGRINICQNIIWFGARTHTHSNQQTQKKIWKEKQSVHKNNIIMIQNSTHHVFLIVSLFSFYFTLSLSLFFLLFLALFLYFDRS